MVLGIGVLLLKLPGESLLGHLALIFVFTSENAL